MYRPALLALVLAVAPACKKDAPADKDPPKTGADAGPKADLSERAAIFLDDKQIGEVDIGKATTFQPLQAMLPPEVASLDKWAKIQIRGVKGLDQTLIAPSKTHPGEVAAVFATEGGVAFGFFLPEELAKKGKPKMMIPTVVEVRVYTTEMEGGSGGGDGGGGGDQEGDRPVPTKDLKFEIKVGGKTITFDGEQLAKVPNSTAPIGDTETQGWTLPAVLDAAGVPAKSLKGKVVLYGDEGANLILEPGDLDPAKANGFIKLNRQGKLRFRLFRKAGETWDIAGELRGIATIEIK